MDVWLSTFAQTTEAFASGQTILATSIDAISLCSATASLSARIDSEGSFAGMIRSEFPRLRVCNTAVWDYGTDQPLLALEWTVNQGLLHPDSVVLLMNVLGQLR